ncbi:MAG: sugar ABC transporter permease [Bacilli bacterium]|jgi:multiple sugar transport system permease protein|nr:sugar ABC transporter permease [Bacilli bacterium]
MQKPIVKTHDYLQKRRGLIRRNISGWSVMLPGIILFAFFVWIPLLSALVMSFTETIGFEIQGFVWFDNFVEIFNDVDFRKAFQNTFVYLGWSLLIGFIIPIILGLLLSETIHFKGLFRIGIYMPSAIAGLTIAILFSFLFDPSSTGFLNNVLKWLGFAPLSWLEDPDLVIPLIVVTMTWRGAGATALIYLSAFQQIKTNYYEAARIDGANTWQRIFNITLPSILPSLSVLFVLQVISVMQVFFEPLVMTNGGGADRSSLSMLLLAYQYAFQDGRADLSSATTFVLFLIILGLSLVYFALVAALKKRGYKV